MIVTAPASAIAAGGEHACAIMQSGSVKCWGFNKYGQLGTGTTESASPIEPAVLGTGYHATAIGAGDYHSCAVLDGGKIICWGDDGNGQLGDPTSLASGFAKVSGGNAHTCAITTDGGVKCWGSNSYGQLGSNAPTGRTPVTVSGLTNVTALTTGYEFTCAIANGGVKCWGSNTFGTLGIGSSPTSTSTPTSAIGLTSGMISVSGINEHTCAVRSTGGVACWGNNFWGQLGVSSPMETDTPIDVPALGNTTFVSAGGDPVSDDHTCAITTSKTVLCWGINTDGQLGRSITGVGGPVPGAVSGVSDVTSLSSGGGFSCALTSTGTVFCWGNNQHHQLGPRATSSASATAVQVTGL